MTEYVPCIHFVDMIKEVFTFQKGIVIWFYSHRKHYLQMYSGILFLYTTTNSLMTYHLRICTSAPSWTKYSIKPTAQNNNNNKPEKKEKKHAKGMFHSINNSKNRQKARRNKCMLEEQSLISYWSDEKWLFLGSRCNSTCWYASCLRLK